MAEPTPPVTPPRRILVVDDEPFVCEAVKMLLDFDRHMVETARGAREALERFALAKYDLIITDFEMPEIKGDALAIAIKERDPNQPVVMITAYAEMLQASKNPLTGVNYIISKPFTLESLRKAVGQATQGRPPVVWPGSGGSGEPGHGAT